MKIVLLDAHTTNPGDISWERVEAIAPCDIFPRTPVEAIVDRCQDAEVVLTNKAPLTRETIDRLPDLRYIGVTATGTNIVDLKAAREKGITVTNVPGYGTPAVAQHVFALILELTNHVGRHAQSVREGHWSLCPDFSYWERPLVELQGRCMGIIGFGEIGSAVARLALAFDMTVVASRREWREPPPPGVRSAETDTIFSNADVVSLHCPLTEETRHLVNARTLGLMQSSALVINTARGPLVDEPALAHALNTAQIAGAGLDVLGAEPPSPSHPLLQTKNCLITPHHAWATRAARQRLVDSVADNLQAFLAGRPVNVVN